MTIGPIVPWEKAGSNHFNPEGIVWHSIFDNQFLVEVRRTGNYSGRLYVFDHFENDEEVTAIDVSLMHGAAFGPDIDDVLSWEELVSNVVDALYERCT